MGRQAGFTLTELLVVSAIVAILLAVGVPSYRYITNSYRLSAEVNSLLGDLQYARSEAIKEGQTVVVCVSVNASTCSGNNDWARGWLIFVDLNKNGQVQAGDTVLRVQAAFSGTNPDTFTPSNNVSAVSFNREGFATTAAGFVTTTFTLVDGTSGNAAWTRCLILNQVGMVTTQTHDTNPGSCG